jgi:hypothetical protein
MIDFLIGLVFVAMIITPALVASSHRAEASDSYFDDFPDNAQAKAGGESSKENDSAAAYKGECATTPLKA